MLDDDGNVITKEEIEANMGTGYQEACIIGGGCLGVIPAVIGGTFLPWLICGDIPDPDVMNSERCGPYIIGVMLVSMVGLEVATITASRHAGKHFDRQRAIERIKDQRRKKKENAFGEQDITDGFYFQLLKGTF